MNRISIYLSLVAAASFGASIHQEKFGWAAFNACIFAIFMVDAICDAIKEARK